ncbi:hypothetical protein MO973_10145 [Paenibacillus sp. TRM 82003]|nr:hypothetical protein [Paenibacillus sp. TRM 82003]
MKRMLPYVAVGLLLIGSACAQPDAGGGVVGEATETSASEGSTALRTYEDVEPAALVDVKQGADAMNDSIKAFKQAVESEDDDLAGKAVEMTALWKAIRLSADAEPSQTEAIERLLAQILELSQAEEPDRETLIRLDYELYQKFRDAAGELAAA